MAFYVELVCLDCADTTGGRHVRGGSYPHRKMETAALKRGWSKVDHNGYPEHLCPGCTHERATGHKVFKGSSCMNCTWPSPE